MAKNSKLKSQNLKFQLKTQNYSEKVKAEREGREVITICDKFVDCQFGYSYRFKAANCDLGQMEVTDCDIQFILKELNWSQFVTTLKTFGHSGVDSQIGNRIFKKLTFKITICDLGGEKFKGQKSKLKTTVKNLKLKRRKFNGLYK